MNAIRWMVALLRRATFRFAERVLDLVPVSLLTTAAARLARTRPLGRFPGWRFAIEEETPTLLIRIRRLLWDHFRKAGIERPVRVNWFDGLHLDLVLGNDQSRCLYVGGSFEPNEFALLARVLRPGMAVVDAGASEGPYTVFMARRVGADGLVIAVEPSPRERARLERNVSSNDLRNVRIVSNGLAAQTGRGILHIAAPEHSGQNTLGSFVYQGVSKAGDIEIDMEPLDSLVGRLGGRRIDLIKVDVEGAELGVLRGAERLLSESRPVILFELLDAALRAQDACAQEVLDFLTRRGFDVLKFDVAGTLSPLSGVLEASNNLVAVPSLRLAELLAAARS